MHQRLRFSWRNVWSSCDWLRQALRGHRSYRWKPNRPWRLLLSSLLALSLSLLFHLTQSPLLWAFPTSAQQQAQTLMNQGQQALSTSDPEAALKLWQQAEAQYQEAKDKQGIWGSQLNQAKALQTLGFYRQAQSLLSTLSDELRDRPTSLLQLNVLLTQGQGNRLLGNFAQAQTELEQGLAIAEQLDDPQYQQAAHLYLGNALAAQSQWSDAAQQFEAAAKLTGPLTLTAELRETQMLASGDWVAKGASVDGSTDVATRVEQLIQRLPQSSSAQTQLYLTLDLAQWLLQPEQASLAITPEMRSSRTTSGMIPTVTPLLENAIQQAQRLGDRRAESYGLGYLGRAHEIQGQRRIAEQQTQQALTLARALNAEELAYQWQWQLGRLAKSAGSNAAAISHYTAAVETLSQLRQDLVAMTRDVQFSFRDQIQPIYRELVNLLLTSAGTAQNPEQALELARQTLESLQLVELNNFFREPCIESIPQPLDALDPAAAVLYPIILPEQLAVILSIPGQPLSYYSTPLSQDIIEEGIQQMQRSMRVTSFEAERLKAAQQLYSWLIKPAEAELQAHQIKQLVVVPDGSLRNLPLAALHSGQHYLAEDYQLAVSPGLQLLKVDSSRFAQSDFSALVGGLSAGGPNRSPLPGVETEVAYIQQAIESQVLLNDTFTTEALSDQTQQRSFNIVHLAAHAQFGETDADTFIETWDGVLRINQLRQLLKQQDTRGLPPQLLVLSACDTAQGDDRAVLGMAGVAVRSGAESTLATLWTVNDEATATFVQHFYEGLIRKGFSRAEAVSYAQQQLLHTDAFKHPFYWAPFTLVGDWT